MINMKTITQVKLMVYVILFIVVLDNFTFFQNVFKIYPPDGQNIGFLISLFFLILFLNLFFFILFSSRYTTKPILIILLIVSSFTTYFMGSYHIVVDTDMIKNILQTNLNESSDLLSVRLIIYVMFLGFIPSAIVYKAKVDYRGIKIELWAKLKMIILSLIVIIASVMLFSKHYASFIREHKPLRYLINPTYWVYSIEKYIGNVFNDSKIVVAPLGTDARIKDNQKRLIIMVVGEAARADHFSLNGYSKETNPLLEKDDIIDLPNTYSCGTSTAYSVPCMFSKFTRDQYSHRKAISNENVMDVLHHTNSIDILWRDNNSDPKGVMARLGYEDYKSSKNNTICTNGECRDEGMLVGLDKFVTSSKKNNIFIVLHQMGNHGPAYYKRYPKAYEEFKPICQTNQLEECTKEEINHAYDNAILYTDYFLDKTINFLKHYDSEYKTAMIYMSDHGESLGENGVYLHGLPYFMAPEAQKHIGAILWFGDQMKEDIDINALMKNKDKKYSQDNLFHTLLGLFDVETKVYNNKLDMIHNTKKGVQK